MSLLPAFMLTLTLAVLTTVIPRFVYALGQCNELAATGNREGLQALLGEQNGWIMRHFFCAAVGTALVVMMKTLPHLNPPEHLADITGSYAMISFGFALLDSLLAQKIARLLAVVKAPAKTSRY